MKLKDGVLHLNSDTDNEKLYELLPKLQKKIEKIEEVIVDENSIIASSALFAVLASLKKSKQSIKISYLENDVNFAALGNVTFIKQG